MDLNEPADIYTLLFRRLRSLFLDLPRQLGSGGFWRSLLAGNPFYLLSAGMMLYGIYLVSVDPQMAGEEVSQLAFNFSSLQLYEVLLVATAILLARRSIWYDSTLLVALENMFVLVPFILVSQATLINQRITTVICVAGSGFALAKFWSLKRYIKDLNLPVRLLTFGVLLLLINLMFPLYFRRVIEVENEAWTNFSPYLWNLLLPLLAAMGNLLPRPHHWGGTSPQRSWLPQAFLLLWLTGTAVHVVSMDYVDNQKFHYFRLTPLLWVCCWTLYHRLTDFVARPAEMLRIAVLGLPLVVSVLALWHRNTDLFAALMALNAVIYGVLLAANHQRPVVYQLLLISLAAFVAGIPEGWGYDLIPAFSRAKSIILGFGAYAWIIATRSRYARSAIFGALLTGFGTWYQFDRLDYVEQFAMQNAFIYLLLHSLRWCDGHVPGARPLRLATGCAWVIHSFAWGYIGGLGVAAPIALSGLLVLVMYLLAHLIWGDWGSRVLLHAGWLTIATVPVNFVIDTLKITPRGHLTVLGSFILFALGTLFALKKDEWFKASPPPPEVQGPKPEVLPPGPVGETV